jgi:hypothetical protein
MEAAVYVGRTLDIVQALKRDYDNVGVCVQSYLYRSRDDLERLNRLGIPVRLVKGAYQESPEVAYPQKASVDHAYARMLDDLLAVNPYPMVATHDPAMVRLTKNLVAHHHRDRGSFEFQMLYGVRRDLQDQVVSEGYRLRREPLVAPPVTPPHQQQDNHKGGGSPGRTVPHPPPFPRRRPLGRRSSMPGAHAPGLRKLPVHVCDADTRPVPQASIVPPGWFCAGQRFTRLERKK